ncbi:tRNA N(3)-methylcytidine methyltransferase trm141 isoform X2 [Apium graveolens]|uniref:tRNA N(3)-methylcytidine methyltransferase trm141 isoform X2 n=1 Tax=Apium graveolens TaxID=4045 RepID=UPI003D7AA06D
MASDTQGSVELKQQPPVRIQIYSTPSNEITPFWREKYEREAKKYWDNFYKRHQDRFFKDRHYLDKEWGQYFSGAGNKVVLEVGCGAGNTIFPLVATYPDIFVQACDFSPRAVELVKMHKDFTETRVNAFVCDLTAEDLSKHVSPASVDIVTMIFVLSAVSPEKMSKVLHNIKKVLKPNGFVLFRDYAAGDLAQERLASKDQKISENFYVRGDGTRAFYFSEEFLGNLVKENGFDTKEHSLCCKQVENRSRELVMNRRWVQAVFHLKSLYYTAEAETKLPVLSKESTKSDNRVIEPATESEIDMSEGISEMFGMSNSNNEENLLGWGSKGDMIVLISLIFLVGDGE